MSIVKEVKYNDKGLVPVIVQDERTRDVLMLGYANEEALRRTIETGRSHFYSRSRKKMWVKGESSGHVQTVREIRLDCDGDAVLYIVEQKVAACHLGYYSCFFRKADPSPPIEEASWTVDREKVFNPDEVY